MAREITGARDCLVRLDERFPNQEQLTKKDVCTYLDKSYNTVRKKFPELWETDVILKSDFAKLLARKTVS